MLMNLYFNIIAIGGSLAFIVFVLQIIFSYFNDH